MDGWTIAISSLVSTGIGGAMAALVGLVVRHLLTNLVPSMLEKWAEQQALDRKSFGERHAENVKTSQGIQHAIVTGQEVILNELSRLRDLANQNMTAFHVLSARIEERIPSQIRMQPAPTRPSKGSHS